MEKTERKRKPKKTWICIYCDKQLSSSTALKNHLKIHNGQKDFSCSYCQKKFARKDHVKFHEKIHTGLKDFSCSYCEKKFSQRGTLNLHEMIHTGKKGYNCALCGYKTTRKGNLDNHIRTHLKEKPYKCQEPNCGPSFVSMSGLKKHQLVHKKHDKSLFKFSCPICPFKCALKILLNHHLKTHEDYIEFKTKGQDHLQQQVTGIQSKERQRYFNCDRPDCNYTSKTKGLLNKHLKTHSQENLST